MQIPIENIYYLLCYAWNKLEESTIVDVSAIDVKELVDLFAKILINGCSRILKQGLDRYYVEQEEMVSGIKGKLNLSLSVKQNTFPISKTHCSFDEFDYDILNNQIIKTTIKNLLQVYELDSQIKGDLYQLYHKLPPISEITIQNYHFTHIRLNKNNYHYSLILKICQLINENMFIDEASGKYRFKDFLREDKAMASLFEAFIRNFYKIEQSSYKVTREYIYWQFDVEREEDMNMLPLMETDITLKSPEDKIIIDAKYYKEAFQTRYTQEKIDSGNLYQLFSYLNNQENESPITQSCRGILLYPSVEKEFSYRFKYQDHKIDVMSINLNQKWQYIKRDLLYIINV